MIRVGVVGLGKMGLSHLSMVRAHPDVEVAARLRLVGYVLDVLGEVHRAWRPSATSRRMLDEVELDAIVIATPTRLHAPMVRAASSAASHVFCEKPFCLDRGGVRASSPRSPASKGLVTQVGYHNRFVGAFREVKRLLDAGAIGRVTHVLAEAYGPVVLKPKGSTWRSQRSEGGGLPLRLRRPPAQPAQLVRSASRRGVGGTVLGSVFSQETDDEVFGTLFYADGASAQLSVNWTDES